MGFIHVLIFSDPAVQALQFLDVIGMKDPSQKAQFFRVTMTQVFPFIPRVWAYFFKLELQKNFLFLFKETLVPTYLAIIGTRNTKSRSFSCCFGARFILGWRMQSARIHWPYFTISQVRMKKKNGKKRSNFPYSLNTFQTSFF